MLDLYEELGAIVAALNERRIEYALCGGLAMAVHGFVRATVDIDLLVPADQAGAIEDAVAGLGYIASVRPISKFDPLDGGTMLLDLHLVTPATAAIWANREQLACNGRPIEVVSREGLISLKRARSSGQDLADIERMTSADYSDRAIAMRLQRVSQLRKLCLSLAKAKPANRQPSTATPPRD